MAADIEGLFAAYRQPLFRYFCRAAGHVEAAKDLTQDVFLRASRAAVPTADARGVQAWLFSIARNLVIDYHRRRRREPGHVDIGDQLARMAPQEAGAAVSEALSALADLDRDVFLMREVSGLGYEQIAAACGLTPDAVRSRLHRTRLDLRQRLASPIATTLSRPLRQSGRKEPR